jgi:rod shape-determining protein MreD
MNSNLIKDIVYGLIVAVFLAIQSSNLIAIGGVFPDLMMILIVAHSFYFGEFKGEIFGFSMGVLVDAMSGTLFGLNAFVYTFLAWFTTIYKRYILVSDIVAFVLYIFIATIIKYIFYVFFHWAFLGIGLLDGAFFLRLGGEILYNLIIAALLFFLTPFLYKREDKPF